MALFARALGKRRGRPIRLAGLPAPSYASACRGSVTAASVMVAKDRLAQFDGDGGPVGMRLR